MKDGCYWEDERDKTKVVENSIEDSVFWAYSIKKKKSDRNPID